MVYPRFLTSQTRTLRWEDPWWSGKWGLEVGSPHSWLAFSALFVERALSAVHHQWFFFDACLEERGLIFSLQTEALSHVVAQELGRAGTALLPTVLWVRTAKLVQFGQGHPQARFWCQTDCSGVWHFGFLLLWIMGFVNYLSFAYANLPLSALKWNQL